MAIKLKWKVSEAPTGPFRSFDNRMWPNASYPSGEAAVQIYCQDKYTTARARGKDTHAELSVNIAFHHPKSEWKDKGGFTWRTLKAGFATLAEAKEAAGAFINAHPEVHPKDDTQEPI